MQVLAIAPGKVTLFGEHAIVYGKPAIVAAIDKRVMVSLKLRDDGRIRIAAYDLMLPGVVLTFSGEEVVIETDYGRAISAVSYIKKALEITSEYVGKKVGVDVEVRSEMPVGAGLGTSAAVSVATIKGYGAVLGVDLSVDEVAKLGHKVELEVQGAASPMDTMISSRGGFIFIKPLSGRVDVREIRAAEIPIVIGYVAREAKTGELVAKVKRLRDKHLDLVDKVLDAIEVLVLEAEEALKEGDFDKLGDLMNINHGLLEALGVSNKRLSELVYVARSAGALGAKLTGAGGGGCMIALAPGKTREVAAAITSAGGVVLEAKLGGSGVSAQVVS